MTSRSGLVRTSDIRPLMELAGQLGELPADLGVRMQHLLRELCTHCHAFSGVATITTYRGGDFRHRIAWMSGYEDGGQRAALQRYFQFGGPADPARARVLDVLDRADGRALAVRRGQLVCDREWYASGHLNEVRRPVGVDHCVHSLLPLPGTGCFGLITLSRAWGERRIFSARECATLQLFHEGIRWIYRPGAMEAALRAMKLSPRLREVLAHMQHGRSEKEIAHAMGLSRHTVHGYVAELHRRMEVRSRGELLALWM